MNHTMFARTDLGVMAYDRDTGEWTPKALTQIPTVIPLELEPDLTAPVYGAEIRKLFAENRYQLEMK